MPGTVLGAEIQRCIRYSPCPGRGDTRVNGDYRVRSATEKRLQGAEVAGGGGGGAVEGDGGENSACQADKAGGGGRHSSLRKQRERRHRGRKLHVSGCGNAIAGVGTRGHGQRGRQRPDAEGKLRARASRRLAGGERSLREGGGKTRPPAGPGTLFEDHGVPHEEPGPETGGEAELREG